MTLLSNNMLICQNLLFFKGPNLTEKNPSAQRGNRGLLSWSCSQCRKRIIYADDTTQIKQPNSCSPLSRCRHKATPPSVPPLLFFSRLSYHFSLNLSRLKHDFKAQIWWLFFSFPLQLWSTCCETKKTDWRKRNSRDNVEIGRERTEKENMRSRRATGRRGGKKRQKQSCVDRVWTFFLK